jgi:hypothetical protein
MAELIGNVLKLSRKKTLDTPRVHRSARLKSAEVGRRQSRTVSKLWAAVAKGSVSGIGA